MPDSLDIDLIKAGAPNTATQIKYTVNNKEVTISRVIPGQGKTAVEIPQYICGKKVVSIGDRAFAECAGLTSITLPYGVSSIGDRAFSNCCSLVSIEIPGSVASIGSFVFSDCSSLKSINIPDGVTSNIYGTFNNCTSLTSVTIPTALLQSATMPFTIVQVSRQQLYR